MKTNKKVLLKLEQYYSSVNEPRPFRGAEPDEDVPYVSDTKEYKTFIPLEDKDIIPEPIIKTKNGKNVLRDPVDPEDSDIEDLEVYDKKGKEIEECNEDLDESFLFEQNEKDDENKMNKLAQDNMGEQNSGTGVNPNIDPNQENPDPNLMMGGTGGMTQQDPNLISNWGTSSEPELSAENVGKVFELKKIYSRLLSIESQLSFSSDIILLKLRRFISKAIELFETVISNITSYRSEIDGIIILYYQFLKQVYLIMKRYYMIKDREKNK